MDINNYIKKYGVYTFEEKEFTEVDNVIFSVLTYIDYSDILTSNNKVKLSINTISKKVKKIYENKINIQATKSALSLLSSICNTKRYKNILMYNYEYVGDEASQFSCVTFEINKKLLYIAYEGTDQLISGWEEDCKMAYEFPVKAHVLAKNYLRRFIFTSSKIIIGGHSKGGNLALVASMYCNYFVKRKIIKIYSNDGQGLRKSQLESKYYSKIEDRYVHIIPNNSIVGLLLRHKNNYIVVKSSKTGILAHDATTWLVEDDHFKYDKLSRLSRVFDEGFSNWLNMYDDEKRKMFVNEIFNILKENNIKTLIQIKENKDVIFEIIKSLKNVDPIVREMLFELLKVLNKTNFEIPLFRGIYEELFSRNK